MSSRQAGHSTLIKKGTENYDRPFLVLAHTIEGGKDLGFKPTNIVSIHCLDRLRGASRPLIIDNGAMTELLIDTIMRIDTLKEENKKLTDDKKKFHLMRK